jgi:DNA-binding beta-propeller fold protein YncE
MPLFSIGYKGPRVVNRTGKYRRRFLQTGLAGIGIELLGPRLTFSEDCARESPNASPLRFMLAWGKKGSEPGEFNVPIGLALGPGDEVFVSDNHNDRVQRFAPDGRFVAQFPVAPGPGGIAVDRAGLVYVAPLMEHKICVYDRDGSLVRQWGQKGNGDGQFDQPGGIAVAPDGTIYVADQVNRRIQRFTPEGRLLCKWGEYGDKPGQFDGRAPKSGRVGGPNFVAVDPQGYVYTTEAALGRVQKFTADGQPLLAFGSNTTEPGGFGGRPKNLPGPIAVCLDRSNRLWVSATNNRVQRFSAHGEFLDGATSLAPGSEPGQFNTPHAVVIDAQGNLYVCDTQNCRIQKFVVAEPRPDESQR